MRALLVVLSLFLLGPSSAQAGSSKLRSLDGSVLRVDAESHSEPSLMVTFRVDDSQAAARAQAVRDFARPRGLRVLLISTDPVQDRIQVKKWARRHGAGFPVFTDPDGSVSRATEASTVLVSADGERVGRWGAWDDKVAGSVQDKLESLPKAPPSPQIGAVSVEDMPMLEVTDGPPSPPSPQPEE